MKVGSNIDNPHPCARTRGRGHCQASAHV